MLCVNNLTLQFLSSQVGPLINHKNQYWQPVWHLFQWVTLFQAVGCCRNCRHIVVTFSSLITGFWTKEWLILIRRAAVAWGDPAIDSVYCLLSDGSTAARLGEKQEVKDASENPAGHATAWRRQDRGHHISMHTRNIWKYNLGKSVFSEGPGSTSKYSEF